MVVVFDKEDGSLTKVEDSYLEGMLFMGSPVPIILILLSYLLFTKKIGPYLMKDRPAFNLSKLLIVYNAVQVVVSCYIVFLGAGLIKQHGLFDETCSSRTEPHIKNLLYGNYIYFLAKVSELLDTIFFVLRKKQNQVTFLHVYHHSIMVISVWASLRYEASHGSTFLGTLNSFIHVVMYSYYGLSAIPALRNHLWWKKYLTSMQLIQFALVLIHILAFAVFSKCPPSYVLLGVIVFNGLFFTYLFTKFYINAYLGRKATKPNMTSFICSNVDQNNDDITNDIIKDVKTNCTKIVNGNGVSIINGSSKANGSSTSFLDSKKVH